MQGAKSQASDLLQQAIIAHQNWRGDAWAEALVARHPDLVDRETLIRATTALSEKTSVHGIHPVKAAYGSGLTAVFHGDHLA